MEKGQLSNSKLIDAQKATYFASTAIQAYVASITQQALLNVEEIQDLSTHHETAREHALEWTQKIQSDMIKTNVDIKDYSNQYKAHHDELINLAGKITNDSDSTKVQFIDKLTRLRNDIANKKSKAMTVKTSLISLHLKLSADYDTFKADADQATKLYEETSDEIAELSREIDKAQESKQIACGLLVGGLIAFIGAGVLAIGTYEQILIDGIPAPVICSIVGGVGGGITTEIIVYRKYTSAMKKLASLNDKLPPKKQGLLGVKIVKGQLNGLLYQLVQAIAAVKILVHEWSNLESSLDRVIKDVDKETGTYSPQLKAMLQKAYQDWNDALSLANNMESNVNLTVEKHDIKKDIDMK